MAHSSLNIPDNLYVGGLWALRRSDQLSEKGITHVLSLYGFPPDSLKNFKEEPWSEYGKQYQHLLIDIDDVEETDILVEFPRAVKFIDGGLKSVGQTGKPGGVFVHCAAGKSRSVSCIIAFLLWKYPNKFDPSANSGTTKPRTETAEEAVNAALTLIRQTRPMAEPNDGFMEQLRMWWTMGCPEDLEKQPVYQRWAYQREVSESLGVGQAPSRLRFEDEQTERLDTTGSSLRCKKCRRVLATEQFIAKHKAIDGSASCQHLFIEPLSWMRPELEQGTLNGRLTCPNGRCGATVGRYDWKGFKCTCGAWLTPAFSLQRAKVDEIAASISGPGGNLGIRLPPGAGRGNL
ncbi:dual specificity phosphatase, putative [Cordyceps militaris CM01]|uniref:protein-tyrosine-phosphatase n=2 Tax=Cordyceps militaris TaxID=73501 RepID=G3JRH5_CORMM|nr:dual specificity phosphatase, putative [Cordyceps militaris CM01]ATY65997.1 dual specificity [Cordyceps militaris]EGX88578.1 dual specificity phosphatase, putative [Cordyceps militaris CM01]